MVPGSNEEVVPIAPSNSLRFWIPSFFSRNDELFRQLSRVHSFVYFLQYPLPL